MASILTLSENELWLSLPTNLTIDEIHQRVSDECESLKHAVRNKDLVIKGKGTATMIQIIAVRLRDSYRSCVIDVNTHLAAY